MSSLNTTVCSDPCGDIASRQAIASKSRAIRTTWFSDGGYLSVNCDIWRSSKGACDKCLIFLGGGGDCPSPCLQCFAAAGLADGGLMSNSPALCAGGQPEVQHPALRSTRASGTGSCLPSLQRRSFLPRSRRGRRRSRPRVPTSHLREPNALEWKDSTIKVM